MIERLIQILTVVSLCFGGWFYVENNFASAADVKRLEKTFNSRLLDMRQKDVENKVFELEFKQRETPTQFKALDGALLERYKRELEAIQNEKAQIHKNGE